MEQKYIEIYTRNAKMMKLYGDELTPVEKFINIKSNGLHMTIRFSDRYGRVSGHSTKQDGMNGFGFKPIGYTHGYRWDVIRIPVTAEQEKRIWEKACEMADMEPDIAFAFATNPRGGYTYFEESRTIFPRPSGIFYGPNHIKYDRQGVMYSFISKLQWWKPSKTKNWCNESCALLLMEVWPDLLVKDHACYNESGYIGLTAPLSAYLTVEPHDLLPDETHYMIANYFKEITK